MMRLPRDQYSMNLTQLARKTQGDTLVLSDPSQPMIRIYGSSRYCINVAVVPTTMALIKATAFRMFANAAHDSGIM